jgi:Rrf2 family transcriptional regulator, cysteine metabolism repressor
MKITYKGDYALKAILDLSYRYASGQVVPLVEISRRQNIPQKYLEQIMLVLKGAGLVESKRGIGGGFMLRRSPEEITIGQVVRLMEGPVEPIACGKQSHDGSCGEEASCAFREVWLQVTNSITGIVDQVTFSRIMQRAAEIKEQHASINYQI